MPRKKSPDPKDITMSARFTQGEADAIDKTRGSTDRSVWLRAAALAHLARGKPQTRKRPSSALMAAPDRAPVPPVSDRLPDAPPPAAAREGDCPHPKARINKGLCGACGTYVG